MRILLGLGVSWSFLTSPFSVEYSYWLCEFQFVMDTMMGEVFGDWRQIGEENVDLSPFGENEFEFVGVDDDNGFLFLSFRVLSPFFPNEVDQEERGGEREGRERLAW